ncbi:MAG TPA: 2-dehydropantoate 2-reductase [Candidatus Eisenbacteria bacterium]|nr:2-dehydropantoate 2-reductase [Candidatus Eisenbacteria bacterium]
MGDSSNHGGTSTPRTAVAVVGAGALGTLLAARLSAAGTSVRVLVRRPERAATLRRDAPGALAVDRPASLFPARLLFLCVKSYQTDSAIATLAETPAAGLDATPMISLQNGWGHMDRLQSAFPGASLAAGTTTLGAFWDAEGAFHESLDGLTTFAPWTASAGPACDEAVSLFRAAKLRAEKGANARDTLWRKLVLNVAVNPVTAVHDVRNGALLEVPALHALAAAAAREAAAVGAARGHLAAPYDPEPLLDALLHDTADNRSSMAEDVAHGRPTEADAIVGAVLREGAAAGIPTPVVASLAERLRAADRPRG